MIAIPIDRVRPLPPHRSIRNDQRKELPMTVTSGATQPTDRHRDLNEMGTCSSPHVIEFFTAREQMRAGSNCAADRFGCRHELERIHCSQDHSGAFSDPREDWVYSLIAGAALVSLLIGILCLPSFSDTKTKDAKPQRDSGAESSFVMQKPG